jgi:hypothetical protein
MPSDLGSTVGENFDDHAMSVTPMQAQLHGLPSDSYHHDRAWLVAHLPPA